ncbi:ATP-binding protein [Sphaerimonospora cavernae]|uniref:ATP-binding protein n=1 Tax=Sphaerimonospora cavernae TaxID=1740611 RepID=A0ABV6U355_9ACTN
MSGAVPAVPYGIWRREFPGVERSVSAAREWARGLLGERVAAPVLDDVVLLLSEVVTNAVAHSESGRAEDGRVTVRMACDAGGVHVEVRDGGSATSTPAVRVPDAADDGGRGLWLVDLLATAWGARQDGTGGSVWFRVAGRV